MTILELTRFTSLLSSKFSHFRDNNSYTHNTVESSSNALCPRSHLNRTSKRCMKLYRICILPYQRFLWFLRTFQRTAHSTVALGTGLLLSRFYVYRVGRLYYPLTETERYLRFSLVKFVLWYGEKKNYDHCPRCVRAFRYLYLIPHLNSWVAWKLSSSVIENTHKNPSPLRK